MLHSNQCLEYAAQTGKPYCIAPCADQRKDLMRGFGGKFENVRGAIGFVRENFRNDGAEGESVHLLADAADLLPGLLQSVHNLTLERDEAREGYHALDKNWERHHEACLGPIRAALDMPDGSIAELVGRIQQLTKFRKP